MPFLLKSRRGGTFGGMGEIGHLSFTVMEQDG
jgi:hypothetical protein